MPHLILEHSSELADTHDIGALVQALFQSLTDSGVFGHEDIRARSVASDNTVTGAAEPWFAHATLRMMPGRPVELRRQLADDLLAILEEHLPDVGALSVLPEEIHRDVYARRVIYKENGNG